MRVSLRRIMFYNDGTADVQWEGGETRHLPITEEEYIRWRNGELIQNVWPNLSADDREFIMTGIVDWEGFLGNH